MGNRGSEEHKLWLFDLAHGNLTELQTVQGFLKYYALNGLEPGHVQNDLLFRTHYGDKHDGEAMGRLTAALKKAADGGVLSASGDGRLEAEDV